MSFDVIEGATAPKVALLGGQPSATYEKKWLRKVCDLSESLTRIVLFTDMSGICVALLLYDCK